MKKRFLAILLGLIMVMSDVTPAFAAGTDTGLSLSASEEAAESESADPDSEDPDISGNEDPDDGDDDEDPGDDDSDDDTDDDSDDESDDNPDGDISGNDDTFSDTPEDTEGYKCGAREVSENFQSVLERPSDYISNDRGTLPSSYRTAKLPDLRNQNPYGTCWAHSTMALAEINLLKKGIYSSVDLSELHLAYFHYNVGIDPLGGLDGDLYGKGQSITTSFLDSGGSVSFSGNLFSTWIGAADESRYPYSSASSVLNSGIAASKAMDDKAHLVGYYQEKLDISNLDPVKKLVYDYGAVSITINVPMNGSYADSNTYLYNKTYNSFYNPNKTGDGHAVTIIGWDDNFAASKFSEKPQGNGAWLVRNSWTTGSFDSNQSYQGYFWLSYYEPEINKTSVCAFDFEAADNYDNNYQYDGAIYTDTAAGSDGMYANVFTAHAAGGSKGETVEAASFYTPYSNVSYKVELYTDISDDSDPTSGALRKTVSGTTTYAGYYTVSLGSKYVLNPNEKFSIVVTLEKNGSTVPIGAECRYTDSEAWFYSSPSAKEGQSFYCNNSRWEDYGKKNNLNLKIKAFTDNASSVVSPASVTFEDGLSMDDPVLMGYESTFRAVADVLPSNASTKLIWSSSDTSVATVDSHGVVTSKSSAGTAVITAKAASGNASASFKVKVANYPVSMSILTVAEYYTNVTMTAGNSRTFKVKTTPEDADLSGLVWSSSDPSILSIDSKTGEAAAHESGTVIVTAKCNNLTATMEVIVKPPVVEEITAYPEDDNSVTITWKAVPGADRYEIKLGSELITSVDEDGSDSYTYVLTKYKDTSDETYHQYTYYIYTYISGLSNSKQFKVYIGPSYSVTYDAGDGINNPGNPAGSKYGRPQIDLLPPTPPVGYTFQGWYTKNANGVYVTKVTGLSQTLYYDQNLYAKYAPITYYFDFDANADDITGSMASKSYSYGTSYKIPGSSFSRKGYKFNGWNTSPDGTGTSYSAGQSFSNLTDKDGTRFKLYAQWEKLQIRLSFNANYGSVDPAYKEVEYGKPYGELPVPVRTGYDFAGWFTASGGGDKVTSDTVMTSTSTVTVYARWAAHKYTVTLDPNGGTADSSSIKVTYNTKYYSLLPTPERCGYTFAGWTFDLPSASSATYVTANSYYTKTEDSVLYARWNSNSYKVTFNANGGKLNTSSTTYKYYKYGQPYGSFFTATRSNYDFVGWKTDDGLIVTTDSIVNIASDHTLTAEWAPKQSKLIFDVNGGDSLPANLATKTTVLNQVYGDLPEATRTGCRFLGWFTAKTGGIKVTSTTKCTSTSNVTVYAHWDFKQYTVYFDPNGGVCTTSSRDVRYNAAFGNLPVATRTGYTFDGWFTEPVAGTQITSVTLNDVADDRTLYAHWTAGTYTVTFNGNGGLISGESTFTSDVTFGQSYGQLPLASRQGFEFAGWYTALDGGTKIDADSVYSTAGDQTLYAHWNVIKYTVTFSGNGYDINVSPIRVEFGAALGELPVPERQGYTFDGWYTEAVSGSKVDSSTVCNAEGDLVLYAHWTAINVTVSFDACGGTVEEKSRVVAYDSAYGALPEPILDGMLFTGWFTAKSGGMQVKGDSIMTGLDDHTLYARWKEAPGWRTVGRKRFYIDEETCLKLTGWQTIDGVRYYFDPVNACLKTGWITLENVTYYLDPAKKDDGHGGYTCGGLVTNSLVTIGGKTYFVDAEGARQTGFVNTPSGKMYFDVSNGCRRTGWLKIDESTYYLDPINEGKLTTGWLEIGNKKYYMDAFGVMQTGKIRVADAQTGQMNDYILDSNGLLQTGWVTDDNGEKVYADPDNNGVILTSELIEDNGNYYYVDAQSTPVKDTWKTVNTVDYYFGKDGRALKGWQEIDGKKYYFDNSAKSVSGLMVIGKKLYYFDNASGDGNHAGLFLHGEKTVTSGKLGDINFKANENGVLSSGEAHYFEIGDSVYFVDRNGNAVTGWIEKDGKRLYLDASTGEMATGVKKIGFKTYYFKPDGEDKGMLYTSGSVTVNGVNYKIRSDGSLVTGWSIGGNKPKPEDNTPGIHNDNQGTQSANTDSYTTADTTAVTDNFGEENALNAFEGQPIVLSESHIQSGNESDTAMNTSNGNESGSAYTGTNGSVTDTSSTLGAPDAYSLAGVQVSDGSYLSDVTITSAEGTVISENTGNGRMLLALLLIMIPAMAGGAAVVRKRQ